MPCVWVMYGSCLCTVCAVFKRSGMASCRDEKRPQAEQPTPTCGRHARGQCVCKRRVVREEWCGLYGRSYNRRPSFVLRCSITCRAPPRRHAPKPPPANRSLSRSSPPHACLHSTAAARPSISVDAEATRDVDAEATRDVDAEGGGRHRWSDPLRCAGATRSRGAGRTDRSAPRCRSRRLSSESVTPLTHNPG